MRGATHLQTPFPMWYYVYIYYIHSQEEWTYLSLLDVVDGHATVNKAKQHCIFWKIQYEILMSKRGNDTFNICYIRILETEQHFDDFDWTILCCFEVKMLCTYSSKPILCRIAILVYVFFFLLKQYFLILSKLLNTISVKRNSILKGVFFFAFVI